MTQISLDDLNTIDEAGFVAALGEIYEHSPWVAEAVAARRPFASLAALHEAMMQAVQAAPDSQQAALIRAHPDLAGKAARAGALTAASAAEQASAGLDRLSEQEYETFHKLNDAYKAKFGMPFIVCVRRHTKDSILRQFERRLANDGAAERATAIAEIIRIAALRLDQKVAAAERLKVHGRLSTHVLDTSAGRPAAGIEIELFELSQGGDRVLVARRVTNSDGRTDVPLIHGRPLPIGVYELVFAVGPYFGSQPIALADPPFLDRIPLRVALAEPEGHYHVPLLVSPWGYTTYRGS